MPSRLFHAVVLGGIAAGGAMACSALDTPGGNAVEQEAPGWESFCDSPWPTTKGASTVLPACIDPGNECHHLGHPHLCVDEIGTSGDCSVTQGYTAVCRGGAWRCKPGKRDLAECRCLSDGGTPCPLSR